MKTNASTLNPFALSYVPIAKREVDDVASKEAPAADTNAVVHDLKLKGHQSEDIPQVMDFSIIDEDSEMDLAYLQMIFPGVSDQSLADVYNVNMGDLEAALDMLSVLEADDEPSDVVNDDKSRDPVSYGDCPSSVKAVTAEGESSTSCGSSTVAAAT